MVWPNTALSNKWVEKQRDLDCFRLEGRGPLIDGKTARFVPYIVKRETELVQRQ